MLLQQRQPRREDYRREFQFNHPDAHPDVPSSALSASWLADLPVADVAYVVESSRRILVHTHWLAEPSAKLTPDCYDVVDMGVPAPASLPGARGQIRSRHGISEDAVVFTALGKVTPEKRLREAIRALASIVEAVPHAHLLVAGETVDYYDLYAEAERLDVSNRVTISGYVSDDEIDNYVAASDVCLCMRWPTSRETSASWLRCQAAGKPTISTDLVHTGDIPTLDPRNWSVLAGLSAVARRDPASFGETRRSLSEAGRPALR